MSVQALERRALLTTFFNDLSATNGGSYTVNGSTWEATEFRTDSSTPSSLVASLLMSQSTAGVAQLDLYSDAGLFPGSLLGTFNAPPSFSASLGTATFSLSGLTLTANTDYWVVLHALSGSFEWGWTDDFTVMNAWAESTNGGSTWFTDNAFPFQVSIDGSNAPVVVADTSVALVGGVLTIAESLTGSTQTLSLAIDTSVSPNEIVLRNVADRVILSDVAGAVGSNTNVLRVPITGISQIAIDTAGGDDALTLDLSGGAFPVGIQFIGGSDGLDSLEVIRFDASSQFNAVTASYSNAHSGQIQLRQGATVLTTVGYSALDAISLDGTPTEAIFSLPSGSNSGVTLLDVGGADAAMRLSGSTFVATDFSVAAAASVVVYGNSANDQISVQSLDAGFVGTLIVDGLAGNDTLVGSARGDVLIGGEGNDSISGGDGSDTVVGGAGADTLLGDNGNDFLNGNSQVDRLEGGSGDDVLNGGSSADVMVGGAGTNVLKSDLLTDIVEVSDATITVSATSIASSGTDLLRGLATLRLTITGSSGGSIDATSYTGPTVLIGSIGNDTLIGGSSNDSIVAGSGNDSVNGGTGNDTINGGAGNDSIDAGSGSDQVLCGDGADLAAGGDGFDTLIGGAGNDSLNGGLHNDVLRGGDNDDQLFGDSGNDILNGGAGNDTLDGGEGHDGLSGFTGNDVLLGGIGRDTLLGGVGNDTIRGSSGNDLALGGDGDDAINADSGIDTVAGGSGTDRLFDTPAEIDELFTFTADWVDAV